MKKKYLYISAFFMAAATSSCSKSDLFKDPQDAISAEDAFSTPDRIDKSAVGMYDALQNVNYFSGRVLIYTDMRGLDVIPNTYFNNIGFYNTLTNSDATVASCYQAAYRTIYQANLFLKGFESKKSLVTQAKSDQYIGEAKFIRSLCYFYLVNLWGQPYQFTTDGSHPGVSLVLTAADDPFAASNQIQRSTVKQVYTQLEADLLDAEAKLPDNYSDDYTRTARATKNAARGLLMRLYLYELNWVKAQQYADAIITTGYNSLNPSPVTCWTNNQTKESIFSVAMSGGDNPNTNNSLGQHYGARARADLPISLDYLNLMDTNVDLRYRNLMEKYNGNFWTKKYPGLTTDFVPVLRYPEVLLTKAETMARQASGVDATAISLVNQIRSRANAAPISPVSQQELIDAIIRERRIELAFEGHGEFEFNRNHKDIPAHGLITTVQAWGADRRVLPMPKYETDKYPGLILNPGY